MRCSNDGIFNMLDLESQMAVHNIGNERLMQCAEEHFEKETDVEVIADIRDKANAGTPLKGWCDGQLAEMCKNVSIENFADVNDGDQRANFDGNVLHINGYKYAMVVTQRLANYVEKLRFVGENYFAPTGFVRHRLFSNCKNLRDVTFVNGGSHAMLICGFLLLPRLESLNLQRPIFTEFCLVAHLDQLRTVRSLTINNLQKMDLLALARSLLVLQHITSLFLDEVVNLGDFWHAGIVDDDNGLNKITIKVDVNGLNEFARAIPDGWQRGIAGIN